MKRLHYGWILLGAATLCVAGAMGIARQGYGIILPSMQAGLGLTNTQAGMLATANLTAYLLLALIGGALASHYGPRVVVTLGLALVGVGMLLTGRAQSFLAAALWRAVTGVGTGATNVPVMGLLSSWFAPQRRGLAAGIAVTGSSAGLIVMGPVVPLIVSVHPTDGWRLCWFIFGGAVLGLALLAGVLLRNRPQALGLGPIGEVETPDKQFRGVGEADGGPATAEAPPAPAWGRVYASGAVWHLGLVYIAYGFSYIIYVTFFVKGLIAEGGYTPAGAGRLFMIMGWASLLAGLLWGWVSDRIGRKHALIIVYLIQAAAFGLYALHPVPLGFTLSALLFGVTAWSIPGIVAAACGDLLGPRLAPAALGFVTVFLGVGQALGPTVAGMIADAHHSLLPAMLVASGSALAGALLSATLHPVHGKRHGAAA